jgi:hypothetical protein
MYTPGINIFFCFTSVVSNVSCNTRANVPARAISQDGGGELLENLTGEPLLLSDWVFGNLPVV